MKALLSGHAGIPLKYANRHGLISGETGTGKTVTLMRLAEQFSKNGVPVFIADVKGDIAALVRSRPIKLIDLYGQSGDPIKVTIGAMGADMLARSLELSDTQAGVVEIAFAYATDRGIPLNTIADFRALLTQLATDRESVAITYGQVTIGSIGVIQRALLRLQAQGGNLFFDSPAYDVADLLQESLITILASDKLIQSPRLYSAFLLYMLTELYDRLPEIGDIDKPRLVFFFDESHLLFADCPPFLLRKIEQIARLIRSKGVGLYFVSQAPADIPQVIRDQLAHKIEHSRTLQIGHAHFESIDQTGKPTRRIIAKIELPDCRLGALSDVERKAALSKNESNDCQAKQTTFEKGDKKLYELVLLPAVLLPVLIAIGVICYYWQHTESYVIGLSVAAGILTIPYGGLGWIILAIIASGVLLGTPGLLLGILALLVTIYKLD